MDSTRDRMLRTFKTNDLEEVNKACDHISQLLSKYPQVNKTYSKRSEQLIAQRVSEALSSSTIDKMLAFHILHLILILYSCIAIPIEVISGTYNSTLTILEILCLCESIFYLSAMIRSSKYHSYHSCKEIIKYYYNKHILEDIAAISPVNLIFLIIPMPSPSLVFIVLRCLRLLTVFRIHSLLSEIMIAKKTSFLELLVFEIATYLVLYFHWIACILNSSFSCGSLSSYLDSLYFTFNIVSGTSQTNLYPCTNMLKLQVSVIMIISVTAIAIINGLLACIFSQPSTSIGALLKEISIPFSTLQGEEVSKLLKQRIEAYTKFSPVLTFNYGETVYKKIYSHIPDSIVHTLLYEYSRHSLKKLPFLKCNDSEVLIKRIALSLKAKIYLPQDYLIYKDDIGDEMYFIEIGKVNIIAPDNSKVIKSLGKGDFFGEMALINNSRRMCSVVASTLCLIHALTKADFNEILQNFPEALAQIRHHSDARSRETTSVTKDLKHLAEEDEEQKSLFNHLNMYSMLASTISTISKDKKRISMLSGMKNIKTGTTIETFEKDRSQLRMHKIRPMINGQNERRKSQEGLGKELVFSRFSKLKLKWQKESDR